MINIQLEDGTILENTKPEKENYHKVEKMSQIEDGRVIPINLNTGEVMKPKFNCLEELKPPSWSVFYKNGKEKEKEIKNVIEKRSKSSSDVVKDQKRNSVSGLETLVGNLNVLQIFNPCPGS